MRRQQGNDADCSVQRRSAACRVCTAVSLICTSEPLAAGLFKVFEAVALGCGFLNQESETQISPNSAWREAEKMRMAFYPWPPLCDSPLRPCPPLLLQRAPWTSIEIARSLCLHRCRTEGVRLARTKGFEVNLAQANCMAKSAGLEVWLLACKQM